MLYPPETKETRLLAAPPPEALIHVLRQRGVLPLALGRVIVATRESQQPTVLQAIQDLGLELQVSFKKGAVMILPSGVNRASGLKAALKQEGLGPEQVIGIGDAENDHALLEFCGYGVAVANAVPALKEHADWVTTVPAGAGVGELIDRMLHDPSLQPRLTSRVLH